MYQDEQLVFSTDGLSYFVDGLNPGQTYQFELQLTNVNGELLEQAAMQLATFGTDSAVAMLSQSTDCAAPDANVCHGITIQSLTLDGKSAQTTLTFSGIQALLSSIDNTSVRVASSHEGSVIYVAVANVKTGVNVVQMDTQTGDVLNATVDLDAAIADVVLSLP